MSKKCAICGSPITFLSENKLSKEHSDIKICFTCYEYLATAHKGSKKAVEILKSRYRPDIGGKVSKYINSLNIDIMPKTNKSPDDNFMELMSNDLSQINKKKPMSKNIQKSNIIRFDKLTESKKAKLTKIRMTSRVLVYVFFAIGFLFGLHVAIITLRWFQCIHYVEETHLSIHKHIRFTNCL